MIKLLKQHLLLLAIIALTGCASLNPPKDTSTLDKITSQLEQADTRRTESSAVPGAVNTALLPPLTIAVPITSAKQLEHRFDLVINDTEVEKVFMAIVADTRYSMMVHPEIKGRISVNLKGVTVLEAMDVLREFYGYNYEVDGTRIYALKPGLQTKIYQVNYITGIRHGSSDINVTSGAAGSGTLTGHRLTATTMSMTTRTDFWSEMEDSVRTIIGCGVPGSTSQSRGARSTGNSGATPRATSTQSSHLGPRERGKTGCPASTSVLVNPISGTLLVRAHAAEHRTVERVLATMQANVERQVILEAKIIDVELNSGAQQGINWAGFEATQHVASVGANTSSINFNQPSVTTGSFANVLGNGLAGGAGLGVALQLSDFSALLNFLQTQGTVNVLSSPRISTINNQKAVLKVGRDEQFVTGFESGNSSTTTTGGTVNSQATPVYSTYFSGISLDVTPQIDDQGNITLHVHPLISEVTEVEKRTINDQTLPFASNNISETDSIVKVQDGQTVVIGGLMTDTTADSRSQVTGAGKIPFFGALFRNNSQQNRKRELVIMIKPTVVKTADNWAEDISATLSRIQSLGDSPDASGSQ
jgi:MSHA biogenesis protein MshL